MSEQVPSGCLFVLLWPSWWRISRVFILPLFVKGILVFSRILAQQLSFSSNWKLSFHCFLAPVVSVDKLAVSLVVAFLKVIHMSLLLLVAFDIFL